MLFCWCTILSSVARTESVTRSEPIQGSQYGVCGRRDMFVWSGLVRQRKGEDVTRLKTDSNVFPLRRPGN